MNPVVLVISFAEDVMTSKQLIHNILGENNSISSDAKPLELGENYTQTFNAYTCNIHTKYFDIDINLVPCCNNIRELPAELLERTEALIVYFDAQQPEFLESPAENLTKLMEGRNLELGLLVTSQLYDDAAAGITYEAAKVTTNLLFDIIELTRSDADVVEDGESTGNGYSEMLEALRNHLWSNVQYKNNASGSAAAKVAKCLKTEEDSENLEENLESFERLLKSMMDAKQMLQFMTRDEKLAECEELAEQFMDLLVDE